MTPDSPPFFIVLNTGSGKRDAETVEATIRGVLEQAGRRYNVVHIDHPRQLPPLARRAVKLAQQQGTVVIAGGDGTINAVAQVVLNRGLPVGVGTLALPGILCRGALGQLGNADNVASLAFDHLTIWPYRRRRIKAAMAGEVTWLHTPLVFQVAPRPLPLLVPACAITTSPADADEGVL